MTVVLICVTLFALVAVATVIAQDKQVNNMKEELETYKQVAERTQNIFEGFKNRAIEEEGKYSLVHIYYTFTEDELKKYETADKKKEAIMKKLSKIIGNSIIKKVEPDILNLGEGKMRYSITLKMKKI